MITFTLRWLVPGVGFALLGFALLGAPGRGAPPLASLWHARVETEVTRAGIIESDAVQRWPRTVIRVAWPPGSSGEAVVRGLTIDDVLSHRRVLEMEVEAYPPGRRIMVRQAAGEPWVDRTDWFALTWTAALAVVGAMIAAAGVVLNRALR